MILCRDKDGDDGACLLAPDELPIELLPGPAAALVADCCQQLECGTRGLLEALPIKVVDSFGNLCESASFEVGGGEGGGEGGAWCQRPQETALPSVLSAQHAIASDL